MLRALMARRRSTAQLLVATSLLATGARAADAPPAPPAPPPTATPTPGAAADDGVLEEGGIPPKSFVWHPWRMFDPFLSRREAVFGASYFREHDAGATPDRGGVGIAVGQAIETRRSIFVVRTRVTFGLRDTANGHFVADLFRYVYSGGLRAGPFEATSQVGLAVADLHFGPGPWGLGFFSPHVGAGLAIQIGKVRIEVNANRDYQWRWTGGPSTFVEGIGLDVGVGGKDPKLPDRFRFESEPAPPGFAPTAP
jgi:hypothetical protein